MTEELQTGLTPEERLLSAIKACIDRIQTADNPTKIREYELARQRYEEVLKAGRAQDLFDRFGTRIPKEVVLGERSLIELLEDEV